MLAYFFFTFPERKAFEFGGERDEKYVLQPPPPSLFILVETAVAA